MDEQGAAEIGAQPAEPVKGTDGAAAGGHEAQVPVNFESGIQPGPDGQPWVWFTIHVALSQHRVLLPPETARKVAQVLPKVITEGVIAARRAKLGLQVASADQMPTGPIGPGGLPGVNGQRHG